MNTTAKLLLTVAAFGALSTGAMAADLGMPMRAAPIMAPAVSSSWDGAYIGANVGYAWGTAQATSTNRNFTTSTTGWLAGAQIGYNFHVADSIVLGVQGDIDWTNETGSLPSLGTYTTNWEGAVVGRLGLDMGQWMPYVEAGVAFENATAAGGGQSFSNTQTGWTVGAGVQVMLADNLSADLEYRYNNYGNASYNSVPIGFSDSQIRIGLNYHF
jgi:outer membrane immunogenic protein